ncbi:UDP-N-acetylmuramoyl-L-alanyl-D-glutamate--2,6-diaminopimelate ligase [Carnimonas bestiolae]|uniref:UDP-N-acetylmuramoyl-L-alanyl-D-glutamate--2, 6-diaminopimelate ligase n=1 Tax=Carnimonas bestiolae TaxID=3402172 RepID=UPI003EDC6040
MTNWSPRLLSGVLRVSPSALGRALAAFDVAVSETLLAQVPKAAALRLDSRAVERGDVFIARQGSRSDGRSYIDAALQAGASLVLCEGKSPAAHENIIEVPSSVDWLGNFLKQLLPPQESRMTTIAVTGTNGKSSVTHYIAQLSNALGYTASVAGTLGVGHPDALLDTGLTTPDPVTLAAISGELAEAGCQRLALEASSHALDQQRLDALSIDAAVLTNLSRDHLDYHGSMAAYAAAKARLFKRKELSVAVVNGADEYANLISSGLPGSARKWRVDGPRADFSVTRWRAGLSDQHATLETPEGPRELSLKLLGRFNLDNALLAIATLYALGDPLDDLLSASNSLCAVPGRMERVAVAGAPLVVVDYAHTPDALENALAALSDHAKGKVWCLFGCGGDRDPGKRAMMAEVAARLARRVVVTDDNPRSEDAAAIRAQIIAGIPSVGRAAASVQEIGDRRQAIEDSIAAASADDTILIAGKGHEAYQEINGVRHDFSDIDIARAAVQRRIQQDG